MTAITPQPIAAYQYWLYVLSLRVTNKWNRSKPKDRGIFNFEIQGTCSITDLVSIRVLGQILPSPSYTLLHTKSAILSTPQISIPILFSPQNLVYLTYLSPADLANTLDWARRHLYVKLDAKTLWLGLVVFRLDVTLFVPYDASTKISLIKDCNWPKTADLANFVSSISQLLLIAYQYWLYVLSLRVTNKWNRLKFKGRGIFTFEILSGCGLQELVSIRVLGQILLSPSYNLLYTSSCRLHLL